MVTYRAVLDLSDELVSFVEDVIAARRSEVRSPWRTLTSFDQAVLTLVWVWLDPRSDRDTRGPGANRKMKVPTGMAKCPGGREVSLFGGVGPLR